jgi:hypothetical protein
VTYKKVFNPYVSVIFIRKQEIQQNPHLGSDVKIKQGHVCKRRHEHINCDSVYSFKNMLLCDNSGCDCSKFMGKEKPCIHVMKRDEWRDVGEVM